MRPTVLISEAFTSSLSHLDGVGQRAAKTTAFDLQLDPAKPGMQFHRREKARDKNFWSVRVNADLRLIVHRSEESLLLCYVGHHDDAYRWAESRRIERHPTTGAAQIVELRETVRETVREVVVPKFVESRKAAIDEEAWAALLSDTWRPFDKPMSERVAVKVVNHLGNEVMKVFRV